VSNRAVALIACALLAGSAGCAALSGLDALEESSCGEACPDATADAQEAGDAAHDGDAAEASPDAPDALDAAETGDADGATDADAQETNPCVGVVCSTPPANECASTTQLKVYSPSGTCDQGTCSYASSLTTCAFGCSQGACAGDPCVGVTCSTPSKSYCSDATHLTVYDLPGTCGAGSCVYPTHAEFCAFGCSGDVCNGDPCVGVTCNKPDASFCSGANELTVFAPTGTCASGKCSYAKTTQYCAFGCDAGACKNDPCAGVSCATAPASYCVNGSTLRSFTAPGACAGGTCGFPSIDQNCPGGCVVGACHECAKSADCPSGRWCNGGSCVACTDDLHCGGACTDCSATSRVCNAASTACVQCVVDSQCGAGKWCNAGTCAACDTATHCGATCSACGGTTPSCSAGACACTASSCPTNQACTGGACAVCKSDGACGATCAACGATKPKCLDQGTTSTCVECLTATDCGAGKTCTGNACVTVCSAAIVDWNWNTGTAPTTTLTYNRTGSNWSVGTASAGPSDGKTWLATKPAGQYDDDIDDWVKLPAIPLGIYASCKIKVTADVWIEGELDSTLRYDGGNLQFTTDATGATGWTVLDGGSMGYDYKLNSSRCQATSNCLVYDQMTWCTDARVAKTGTFTSTAGAFGSTLNLRFTFHSDSYVVADGLYVKHVRVEAVP
jgi:Cys-rich repeat protein